MRYVTIFLVTLVSSCSWSWPFSGSKTGNCLDDGTCEESNPFEEDLRGGTWHCYGVSRDEPWDCSQERNDTKIIAVKDTPRRIAPPEPDFDNKGNTPAESRAELAMAGTISSSGEESVVEAAMPQKATTSETTDPLAGYSNTSFTVQLIALQTLEGVTQYAAENDLNPPMHVKIRSQETDWHLVLLGIYEVKDEADAAADEWASTHTGSARPWVRPTGPLRKAVNLAAP